MYYGIIKDVLKFPGGEVPMNPQVVNDFQMLFNLVCTNHRGPVSVDFGRQRNWEGIVAGQCTQNVHFLQTSGINAFLDVRTNKLIFSEGSPEILHRLLEVALAKEADGLAGSSAPGAEISNPAQLQTQ